MTNTNYLRILDDSPKNLFKLIPRPEKSKSYVFVDEVQYLKNPTNFMKYIYDEYKDSIKLVVSGSSAFYIDAKFKDSLSGRKRMFSVDTLSFDEFLVFKKQDKYTDTDFTILSLIDIENLKTLFEEFCIYGGYPKVVLAEDLGEKTNLISELVYSYIKKDIYEAGIRHEDIFYRLLKILSRQVGGLLNSSELAGGLGVSKTLIDNYLYTMEKSFHIARVKPLFKNMRKELTKMPKIHFLDLGLRNFFADNFDQFELRNDKGMFFDDCWRALR